MRHALWFAAVAFGWLVTAHPAGQSIAPQELAAIWDAEHVSPPTHCGFRRPRAKRSRRSAIA
jgi:hypothetical protein